MKRYAKVMMFVVVIFMMASHGLRAQTLTYCNGFAGNIACTSYDSGASSQTYCSSIVGSLTCTTFRNATYDNEIAQIQRNYEAGQLIGSAIGNVILAAIERHRENKEARQEWDQFVQDTLGKVELACETDPSMSEVGGPVACKTFMFVFNQFIHKHRRDFVVDQKNVNMLADAVDKLPDTVMPSSFTLLTEQVFETAFQRVDKKQLDKKPR
jgi:hypothetical protein